MSDAVSKPPGRIVTFYSYKGGTGRTMALANIAWILASAGKRVLTLDWDLESPGLHRYFHPFLVDKQLRGSPGIIDMIRDFAVTATQPDGVAEQRTLEPAEVAYTAEIQRYASSLEYDFPDGGILDFVSAGRQNPAYSETVSSFDWDAFYYRLGGGAFLEALRDDMRKHYDYVLIDSRTGLSDTAGICTVLLPDVVVDCFTMSTQSIDGAHAVARSIRSQRSEPVDLLPVPMRVEDGELSKLERSRSYARQRFDSFVRALGRDDLDKYWGSVEIPYKVFYAYEEILAAFGDRSQTEGTLLAAYERLTSVLTGQTMELPALPDAARLRWLAEFERRTALAPISLVISYAARDRMWAEWIAAKLEAVGQPSVLKDVRSSVPAVDHADRMIVLLSHGYLRSRDAIRVWHRGIDRDSNGPGDFLVPIRLDGAHLTEPFNRRKVVDFNGASESRARETLLTVLDLPEVVPGPTMPDDGESLPRFPATLPPVWKAPSRNQAFTGRHAILETLREQLSLSPTAAPVALVGLGGVGKTQTALEYAHRFAADYNIVWWISAEQTDLVPGALASLARTLRLPGTSTSELVDAVLEALRKGARSPRWLIIFDSADDPEQLREFMPEGPGDVIVTSRDPVWMQAATGIEVGVFDRNESVELLSRRVSTLPSSDADAIAEKLGDLPLVIEQAAAWLATTAMPPRAYLDLLETRLTRVLEENPPSGYPQTAAATWRLSLDRLRQLKPAAARLLELFGFFAHEPIPSFLLSNKRLVELLAKYDPALRDPLLGGSLVQDITRYALARVDTAINGIRVHRLVQNVIRDGLSPEARETSRVEVQEILAAANPKDPANSDNWSVYEGLRPHLNAAGVLDSTDDDVRQFVLDMVRYLRARSDLVSAKDLAERALGRWREGADPDDPLILLLQIELANTLRTQGLYVDSLKIDEDALGRLRERLGEGHAYTLIAAGSVAADLRAMGKYQDGNEIAKKAFALWRQAFGDDHERTLMAANNAATSIRLVGDFSGAAQLNKDTLERKERVHGLDHMSTLFSAWMYGRDMRELGQYGASQEQLEHALERCRRVLGPDHAYTLGTAKSLAVTLRRLGRLTAAQDLTSDTLERYERVFGRHHPDSLGCALELACVLSALGQHERARARAQDVRDQSREQNGTRFPFTLAAANNLAIFLIRAGEYSKARPIVEEATEVFTELLGEDHPYTLVCQMNLNNVRHSMGELGLARRLDERNHQLLRDRFSEDHPMALAAATNLAISLRDTGAVHDARAQLEDALRRSRRVLGDDHPNTIAIQDGRRINTDIEPLPI